MAVLLASALMALLPQSIAPDTSQSQLSPADFVAALAPAELSSHQSQAPTGAGTSPAMVETSQGWGGAQEWKAYWEARLVEVVEDKKSSALVQVNCDQPKFAAETAG